MKNDTNLSDQYATYLYKLEDINHVKSGQSFFSKKDHCIPYCCLRKLAETLS